MFFDHSPADGDDLLADFDGVAPLFPLGSLTLLPNVVQPFHLFEPRYRQLGADAVEGNGYIAMGILKPDGASAYESKVAEIYPWVCLGKIIQYEPLPEGRWNLIIRGLCRATVAGEVDGPELYRRVHLEPKSDDGETTDPDFDAAYHRQHLVDLFTEVQPKLAEYPAIRSMLEQPLPIGSLADFVAHALDLSPASGAALLKEADAARRCLFLESLLEKHLKRVRDDDRPFPPEFSVN